MTGLHTHVFSNCFEQGRLYRLAVSFRRKYSREVQRPAPAAMNDADRSNAATPSLER